VASHVAPWMTGNGSPSQANAPGAGSFYNDSSDTQSITSQMSPIGLAPASRSGPLASTYESPDASFYDGRRPSVASIATASSGGSKASMSRGGFRKLQGFFGEEFPGRDSSEISLPGSLPGKDQHSRSYSHSRPSHRDRKQSNATDYTRDASPSSSRPRTPVPAAPEVVPFLYQDNTVGGSHLSFLQYCMYKHPTLSADGRQFCPEYPCTLSSPPRYP
jgi:adenylate cyclase